MTKHEGCNCGTDDACGLPSAHDVAFEAHYKIEGLIRLLVKKKLFTESEYVAEMQELVKALYEQQNAQASAQEHPKKEHEHKKA
ncbi:MAG: hypothetical protein WC755_02460 [Candidatus Woesearchaeota archaeon]|jgi:hypothetical protein